MHPPEKETKKESGAEPTKGLTSSVFLKILAILADIADIADIVSVWLEF